METGFELDMITHNRDPLGRNESKLSPPSTIGI